MKYELIATRANARGAQFNSIDHLPSYFQFNPLTACKQKNIVVIASALANKPRKGKKRRTNDKWFV